MTASFLCTTFEVQMRQRCLQLKWLNYLHRPKKIASNENGIYPIYKYRVHNNNNNNK